MVGHEEEAERKQVLLGHLRHFTVLLYGVNLDQPQDLIRPHLTVPNETPLGFLVDLKLDQAHKNPQDPKFLVQVQVPGRRKCA